METACLAEIANVKRWEERETRRLLSRGALPRERKQIAEQASAAREEIDRYYAGELKRPPFPTRADIVRMFRELRGSQALPVAPQPQPQRTLLASASTERRASVEAVAPQPQPQRERAYGGAGFGEIGAEEERVSVWEPPPGFKEDIPEIRITRRSPTPRYGAF